MSRKDYFTGKKAMSGNKKSHAMNHSRRVWNVNLQTVRITLPNGQTKKVKVSAKTLKTLNKKNKYGVKKAVTAKPKPVVKKEEVKKVEKLVETKKVEKPAKAAKKETKKAAVKKATK